MARCGSQASATPATRLLRFRESQPVRAAVRPADRSGREEVPSECPHRTVPFVVTGRTKGERSRAGRVLVVHLFIAACNAQ